MDKEPIEPIWRLGIPARCPACGNVFTAEFDAIAHIAEWLAGAGDYTLARVNKRIGEIRGER